VGTDETTVRDLLVLLPVDTAHHVTDLHIQLIGENGLIVTAIDPNVFDDAAARLEPHSYANDSGPMDVHGQRVTTGWVARLPVGFNPTHPWDIGGDRYPLTVKADYRVDGDSQPHMFNARAAIDAEVASGIYEMGAASSVLPLLCLGFAITRWRRTR
jgi:hypothetical protein